MDFALTDEQQLLVDSARTLLARECPPSAVRRHIDDPAVAGKLSAHLAEWAGLANGPLVDRCLVLEVCGAALLPGPFFPTVALAGPLLALGASEALEAIVDGERTATVALAGPDGHWLPGPSTTKSFVLEADRVDAVVVVNDGSVIVADAAQLPRRRVVLLDSTRRVFEVDVTGAEGEVLDVGPATIDRWLEQAWVAAAADLVGTAHRLLELSVGHARERVQFDHPIGSFQAIQHKLADMALDVERAAATVYYAAMEVDAGEVHARRSAHAAKAAAGAAATHAAREAIQIHGGIGYTWEHDLHLFIRRAYAGEHLLGTRGWHHDRLGELLAGAGR